MEQAAIKQSTIDAVKSDVVLFGIPSWNPTYEEFHAWFTQVTQSKERHCIAMCLANAHTFNLIRSQPRYRQCIQSMDLVLNDGIGFRLASQMRGVRVQYNFNGTDLIPRLLTELEQPLRVFLYGATEESNELATQKLLARYPRMVCAGHLGGFVSDEEAAKMIGSSNADLVLVAKGNPKQEQFIIDYRDALNCKLAVGVGGLFDFVSELKPRAPKLFRSAGMEWAYRLMLEPKRMFGRYVIGNPVFLARALLALPSDKDLQASLSKNI